MVVQLDKEAAKKLAAQYAQLDTAKFVCTDPENNNNKVWEFVKDPAGIIVKYGRVGRDTLNVEPPKQLNLAGKIAEKLLKGYEIVNVIAERQPTGPTGPVKSQVVLVEAAKSQLVKAADPVLHDLVERLVKANKHELIASSGGMIDIDLKTGVISSAVGVIGKVSIIDARTILQDLAVYVQRGDFDNPAFMNKLGAYLRKVPQKVGHSRGWHRAFIPDMNALQRQNTMLDQMEASADLAESRAKSAIAADKSIADMPNVFDSEIKVLTDGKMIDRIIKMFRESANNIHESRHLKPVRFFEVDLPGASKAFENDPVAQAAKNNWTLWHGTRVFNVLSILKSGLIIPRSGGSINITGRMFGDGLYFSDQSTKSLNYSYGYWDGGRRDSNCFMFLFDVAMGNYYTPSNPTGRLPSGYDSMYAQAKKSGVMNNEMIVYRLSQARPRYLIEFDSK